MTLLISLYSYIGVFPSTSSWNGWRQITLVVHRLIHRSQCMQGSHCYPLTDRHKQASNSRKRCLLNIVQIRTPELKLCGKQWAKLDINFFSRKSLLSFFPQQIQKNSTMAELLTTTGAWIWWISPSHPMSLHQRDPPRLQSKGLFNYYSVGKPLNSKHPASPVHLHVPISTIESLLKLTPACSRNTWIDDRVYRIDRSLSTS